MIRRILYFSAVVIVLTGAGITQEKDFTADRHKKLSMTCDACHGEAEPKKAPAEASKACVACHGQADAVAANTKDFTPNPHDNHITASSEVDCTNCHKGHEADVSLCNNCHAGMRFVKQAPEKE